jgi:hypothetical protein
MSEKEMIYFALSGWINNVETGSFSGMDKNTILMLARDDRDMQRKARSLPILKAEQEMFIKQLRKLATKVVNREEISNE